MRTKSLQSCLTLWDPMECSLPGSSVHGILQARILEWVAMPSSKRSSPPRDQTHISWGSCISCIAGRFFTTEPSGKPTVKYSSAIKRDMFESVLTRQMNPEPIIRSEVGQKEKNKYHIPHICMESREMVLMKLFAGQQWMHINSFMDSG